MSLFLENIFRGERSSQEKKQASNTFHFSISWSIFPTVPAPTKRMYFWITIYVDELKTDYSLFKPCDNYNLNR